MEFRITKRDDDQQLAFGWANVSLTADGDRVIDSQNEFIPPHVLEQAQYRFVLVSRQAGHMHAKTAGVGTLVESFVATPEKLEAMGLAKDALPVGVWVGFHVEDADVWKRIKSGELSMFSIGGRGIREPLNA